MSTVEDAEDPCQYDNDGECDVPVLCDVGDWNDCALYEPRYTFAPEVYPGREDPCMFANDGVCDVPHICETGDWNDCANSPPVSGAEIGRIVVLSSVLPLVAMCLGFFMFFYVVHKCWNKDVKDEGVIYEDSNGTMSRTDVVMTKKHFGIASCIICYVCCPCGLLAICKPCDERRVYGRSYELDPDVYVPVRVEVKPSPRPQKPQTPMYTQGGRPQSPMQYGPRPGSQPQYNQGYGPHPNSQPPSPRYNQGYGSQPGPRPGSQPPSPRYNQGYGSRPPTPQHDQYGSRPPSPRHDQYGSRPPSNQANQYGSRPPSPRPDQDRIPEKRRSLLRNQDYSAEAGYRMTPVDPYDHIKLPRGADPPAGKKENKGLWNEETTESTDEEARAPYALRKKSTPFVQARSKSPVTTRGQYLHEV